MALYTTVDDGYDVEAYRSFEALWKAVSNCHRRTDEDAPLWLDGGESVRLTKAAFRRELATGYACIYEDGHGRDWTIKAQQH